MKIHSWRRRKNNITVDYIYTCLPLENSPFHHIYVFPPMFFCCTFALVLPSSRLYLPCFIPTNHEEFIQCFGLAFFLFANINEFIHDGKKPLEPRLEASIFLAISRWTDDFLSDDAVNEMIDFNFHFCYKHFSLGRKAFFFSLYFRRYGICVVATASKNIDYYDIEACS